MYVSRRATQKHGTHQFHLMLLNIAATGLAAAMASNPLDYLVIFLSSGLLYFGMEYRMERQGIRKSVVHVYGKLLTPFQACLMRGFTEGPCCCVGGFFLADRILSGQPLIGWAGLLVFAVIYGSFSALMDYRDIMHEPPAGRGVVGRRNMASPKLVIGVPSVTAIALIGLYHLEQPLRMHGFYYLLGAFLVVAIFFVINGLLQVRLIELKDETTGQFHPASAPFQTLAFTYDALFEMGFLFVLFYLIPMWLGLYSFSGVMP